MDITMDKVLMLLILYFTATIDATHSTGKYDSNINGLYPISYYYLSNVVELYPLSKYIHIL